MRRNRGHDSRYSEGMGETMIVEALKQCVPKFLTADEIAQIVMIYKATGQFCEGTPVFQLVGHIKAMYQAQKLNELLDEENGERVSREPGDETP